MGVFKALEENQKRKFKHDGFTLSVNDRGNFYLKHDKWDCNTSAGGFNGNIAKICRLGRNQAARTMAGSYCGVGEW